MQSIEKLKYLQDNSVVQLDSDLKVPLRFSFGYSIIKGQKNYQHLLRQADERMYASKRERKGSDVF